LVAAVPWQRFVLVRGLVVSLPDGSGTEMSCSERPQWWAGCQWRPGGATRV